MKIETITYKRVKNLGNYESETFQATATLEETDDPAAAAKTLREFVIAQLYPQPEANTESITVDGEADDF